MRSKKLSMYEKIMLFLFTLNMLLIPYIALVTTAFALHFNLFHYLIKIIKEI